MLDRNLAHHFSTKKIGLKICCVYAFISSIWIAFSDRLVGKLFTNENEFVLISTYKGWGFIFLTSLLIYFLISKQIAALEKQTEALQRSEHSFRSLFINMLNAFVVHDILYDHKGKPIDFIFLSVNPAFEKLTCLRCENIIGKKFSEIFPERKNFLIKICLEIERTSRPYSFVEFDQIIGRHFEGEAYYSEPGKLAMHFLDCTDRINAQQKIEHMAYHDALTQLPNQYLFKNQLTTELNGANLDEKRLAVLFLDLDDFKLINNSLGHFYGDELLKIVSQRIKSILHQGDIVARFGGDEFIILLNNTSNLEAISLFAEQLSAVISKPWYCQQMVYTTTCKIGISLYPTNSLDTDTLIKQADTAMHKAKEMSSESYQFYQPPMGIQLSQKIEIKRDLRTALTDGQFILNYQPQVDPSGTIVGVEALIRWLHPEKGLIPPLAFIPFAEESGLITEIGEWVLKTACCQWQEWQAANLPKIFMSVNLSARQLVQPDILSTISRIVRETGMDPNQLILEITETVAMKNPEHTVTILQGLKALGISVSLDDFGMGYSSLIYLKRFPVDSLKIDRSFIQDINTNSEGAIITKAIIALAKNLKYTVVGEGVETVEQLDFLTKLQCDQIQGYLFSKPLSAKEFTLFLHTSAKLTP